MIVVVSFRWGSCVSLNKFNLTSIILATVGTISSILLLTARFSTNQTLIFIMIGGLLLSELLLYLQWRLLPPVSAYSQKLNQLAPILAVYAVVLQFSSTIIYLIILVATLYSWYQLRSTIPDMLWSNPDQRLIGLIFVRIILNAVIRTFFSLLRLISIQIQHQLVIINIITGILIIVLVYGYSQISVPLVSNWIKRNPVALFETPWSFNVVFIGYSTLIINYAMK